MRSPFAPRLLAFVALAATSTLSGCRGGDGLGPVERNFVVTPTTLDFSVVPQGQWLERHLSLHATGRAEVNVTVTVPAPFSAPHQVRLPPGTSVDVVVRFTSPGPGPSAAGLVVSDGEHEQVVNVFGSGADACATADDPCFEVVFDHTDELCIARSLQEGSACRQGCLTGTCHLGLCVGGNDACDDGDPCTVDACGETGCVHLAKTCEVSDPCHVGACSADGGCGSSELADGTPCGPHTCREASICLSGVCQVRARPNAQSNCEYVSVSGNSNSFCAITRGGDARCWGQNFSGQLARGYQSAVGGVAPMQLGATRVVSVAPGAFDTCFSSSRAVSCTLFSGYGVGLSPGHLEYNGVELCSQSGGAVSCSSTPSPTTSLEPVERFSLGRAFDAWGCAIADGGVWCVPLSGNSAASNSVAVALPDKATDVVTLDGYQASGCALLADSSAWCWGGPGAVARMWLDGGVTALAATNMNNQFSSGDGLLPGPLAVCAALADRTECLGASSPGPNSQRPSYRLAALGDVQQLAVGFETVCAVLDGGSLWCVGANHQGSLGDRSEQPQGPQVAAFRASRVWGAGEHTVFVYLDGGGWQWGSDQPEFLADGGDSELTSSDLVALGSAPLAVSSSGIGELCWLDHGGRVSCQGAADPPRLVVQGGATLFAAASDSGLVCAITPDATTPVTCSGPQAVQLGTTWPSWLRAPGGPVTMVTHGEGVCVLGSAGQVWCSPYASALLQPLSTLGPLAQMCVSDQRACAVTPGGTATCWSEGAQEDGLSFAPPVTVEAPLRAMSCGRDFRCTLSAAGRVHCWGDNSFGQLGRDGPWSGAPLPVPLLGPAQSIGSGDAHTCAVLSSGAVQCWGSNRLGQLGVPRRLRADAPRAIQD